MASKINKSPKTIQKKNFSQWTSTLKSGLTHLPLIFFLCFSITNFSSKIFGQAANLDQIRNGSATSPISPANWVNGNAGPQNAHYAEGYSIPYRMHVTGLTSGSHVLKIEWDTKDQNGHAIDYITHFNNMDNPPGSHQTTFGHAAEVIDPTIGIAGLGALSTFAIPAPSSAGSEIAGQPTASFNALPAALRLMTIYGGTITAMSYDFEDAPDATTASTDTRLSITFTTTNTQVLLAWGGHIAAEYDWGAGRGATGVNGSPYHTRLVSIDGSGGNQDRSLKASAVIIPPPLCGISPAQLACPETASLIFDATGSSIGLGISYVWTLTEGSTPAGAQISGSNTGFSITVVPTGTDFIPGGTFNLSLTVNKTGAQSTTCTRIPAGTITNVNVTATATSNTSPVPATCDAAIDRVIGNTSQLNAVGSNGLAPYTFNWSDGGNPNGSFSNENIADPVYTVTANGEFFLKVVATDANGCKDSTTLKICVVGGVPPCKVVGPSPICPGTTNSYIYDPDEDGIANAIPANFTAAWTLENNTNGATISGSTTQNTVSVVSSGGNCNSAYRIKLTLTSTSGLISTSCSKDVSVVDQTAPVLSGCPANVTVDFCNIPAPAAVTATDNCPAPGTQILVAFTESRTNGQNGCSNVITRTWTATDACGNSASCSQTITIEDKDNPLITCPPAVTIKCGDNKDDLTKTGQPFVSDNCGIPAGGVTYTDAPSSPACGTTFVRTWTVVDNAGNSASCSQNITIAAQALQANRTITQSTTEVSAPKIAIKQSALATDLQVKAYPNPYTDQVNFRFTSTQSGIANLELIDIVGRRLALIHIGSVQAGVEKSFSYKIPALKRVSIFYKLSVGNQSGNGFLLSGFKKQ